MRIWETDFCLLCVKLTFMQHSFIEHFMVSRRFSSQSRLVVVVSGGGWWGVVVSGGEWW